MAQLYPKTVKLRIKRLNVSLAPFAYANGASLMLNVLGINVKNTSLHNNNYELLSLSKKFKRLY